MTDSKKAVVLLSGGLDSATCLAIAQSEGFECYALSFDYGQRHKVELESSANVARALKAKEHVTTKIDLRVFGNSALTSEMEVPKDSEPSSNGEIPTTYVPARNTIFLSFAIAYAEVLQAADVFIGVNAIDYSGYPDCRPEFIEAYQQMANLATKAGVEGKTVLKIHTPLIEMTKAEIIKTGYNLGVDYSLTHSCYDPDEKGKACGRCESCQLRRKGFEDANIKDPTKYSGK